ncbi:beta-propeller fold lactonase family protein [Burkholderia sp. WP9]|uniref:YncE family protein n=1 Tax=Burkholderia sp. WP9 TaxID=1500263 RepID=UPI0015A5BDC5|nr:beta-propeller fold lactonase family protein [Burkholderia sp. WP9]
MPLLAAAPQYILSSQDGKVMVVNGEMKTVEGEDSVALIKVTGHRAEVVSEFKVPNSVFGPPQSVDTTPDGRLAFITAGAKRDPANPAKTALDDKVSVADLTERPPRVIETLHAGAGVAGISVSPDGKLAIAASRAGGSITVFSIAGKDVRMTQTIDLGARSGPGHVVFTPDGRWALVTRDGDHRVTVLAIHDGQVSVTPRDIFPGQRPNGIEVSPRGDFAVVANIGKGHGDTDTVSLIDLTVEPPRVVDTVSVGQTPEGVAISPTGQLVGVSVMNGSNKATGSPFYHAHGSFMLLRVQGMKLTKVSEVPTGGWTQGVAFSPDGQTVLVQNTMQKEIEVIAIDGAHATDTGQRLKFDSAPSGMRAMNTQQRENGN